MPPPQGEVLVQGLDGTRHLFFTGKGGNGKTSLACAAALTLARSHGKRVLLVSTDPASNLDEVLGVALSQSVEKPTRIEAVENLWAANIDPDHSATLYREKVLGDMRCRSESQESIDLVAEQLSGQCTVEIAAFDEFAGLLASAELVAFDHVVFDTAPTGHTLRLLALPAAWTNFFNGNQQGASCLGPVSALKTQRSRFEHALSTLRDGSSTTVYLVTRPEQRSIAECDRTWKELLELGMKNQRVIVNGVLTGQPGVAADGGGVAASWLEQQQQALAGMPAALGDAVVGRIPLRPFNMVGIERLSSLLLPPEEAAPAPTMDVDSPPTAAEPLMRLVNEVEASGSGLVMFMGKGGVGKTTLATSLALALADRGRSVHLSTTDPASHVRGTMNADVALPNLTIGAVDPVQSTQKYIDEIVASKGPMDAHAKALLLEDLNSPCTEEIAVFEAFSELIAEAQRPDHFVILDTAPTGHTLLLMDATGAYDREVQKKVAGAGTPLTIMRDRTLTKVVITALPETTPISEALRLQDDLGRAGIKPYAWVLNQCLPPAIDGNPVLAARAALQSQQAARLAGEHLFQAPRTPAEPIGPALLKTLLGEDSGGPLPAAMAPQPPCTCLPKVASMAHFNERKACTSQATAILFDGDWVVEHDLRAFALWLAAQVAADSVLSLDAGDDDLDDAVGDEGVTILPALCFYSGGRRVAKETDIAAAMTSARDVMQVPASWLQQFAQGGGKGAQAAPGGAPISLPADLRRSGVLGGCCLPGEGG